MRRRRFRKWVKWACTVAMGAAVGMSVLSGFYDVCVSVNPGDDREGWAICITQGLLEFQTFDGYEEGKGVKCNAWSDVGWNWGWRNWAPAGDESWMGCWRHGLLRHDYYRIVGTSMVYPLGLMMIPTGLLWYAQRRRFGGRAGRCSECGYDRRGLGTDAKCPECGTVPAPATDRASGTIPTK